MIRSSMVLGALVAAASKAMAQEPPPAQWLRLDPLPAEMKLTERESFDGVPPRFVLLTDGSVFVGGRREVLRGFLDKTEMQAISTRLDLAMKSLGKAGPPKTLVMGEAPGRGRWPRDLQILRAPRRARCRSWSWERSRPREDQRSLPLPDFVRRLAGFRHPSLKPWDPAEFTMIVRERTLTGGCRIAKGLPSLAQAASAETIVPEALTRTFPTGPDMAQVCEGPKRYTVVFRPLIPGGRQYGGRMTALHASTGILTVLAFWALWYLLDPPLRPEGLSWPRLLLWIFTPLAMYVVLYRHHDPPATNASPVGKEGIVAQVSPLEVEVFGSFWHARCATGSSFGAATGCA